MDKNVCRKVPPLSMMFKIKFNTRCYSVTKVQSHIQYPSYGISQFTHFIHLRSKKIHKKNKKTFITEKYSNRNFPVISFQRDIRLARSVCHSSEKGKCGNFPRVIIVID